MGEIADMMISGVMCEMCGTALECDECEETGIPAYCSKECAKDRGRGVDAVCSHSDDVDEFAEMKAESKRKRWANDKWSIEFLKSNGVEVKVLNANVSHYRIGEYDFWATTGKYIHRSSGKSGRGVKNLYQLVKQK